MSGWRILAVVFLVAGLAQAGEAQDLQSVEFTPFYGVAFSGNLEDSETGEEFEIDDSGCFGGIVDLRVSDSTQLELFFSRQETELGFDDGLFAGETLFDIDVDYYHVGGTYVLTPGPWQPFVVGTLGATYMNPDARGTDSETWFSIGLGGGVRFFPLENLGLYLAGRGFFTSWRATRSFAASPGRHGRRRQRRPLASATPGRAVFAF